MLSEIFRRIFTIEDGDILIIICFLCAVSFLFKSQSNLHRIKAYFDIKKSRSSFLSFWLVVPLIFEGFLSREKRVRETD